jgi:hypothetical protein
MITRLLIMVIAVLLVQGCVTFVEPSNGPRAQVRFASYTKGPINVRVSSYEAEKCEGATSIASLAGIAFGHNRKKLGMPLGNEFDDKNITETYVRANKPFIFHMGWKSGGIYTAGVSCTVTTVFVPEDNQMYEASFESVSDGCMVNVNRIDRVNGVYTRVPESTARLSATQCTVPN